MDSDQWIEVLTSSDADFERASQAVRECPSVDVWLQYARIFNQSPKGESSGSRPTLEDGLIQTGLWLDSSDRFWTAYIETFERTASKEAVIAKYLERLGVPHVAIDQTFTDLSTYISDYEDYEAVMVQASKVRAKTRKLLVDRERWELQKPIAYDAYLEWELERFSANARWDFCVPLFERILTGDPRGRGPTAWTRFIRHTWFNHSSHKAEQLTERSLVYFPDSAELWSLLLRIVSDAGNDSAMVSIIERAKHAGIAVEKTPEMLYTYCAWLARTRPGEAATVREIRSLVEPAIFSPYVPTDQLSALSQVLTRVHEVEIARKAWRRHAATRYNSAEFWEGWVAFELEEAASTAIVGDRVGAIMKLWKMYIHLCRVDDHLLVRRQVTRVLSMNGACAEAEKISAVGETTIWVSHIPDTWNEITIRTTFEEFGPIRSVRFPANRSFCYVQFENHAAAGRALSARADGIQVELSQRPLRPRPPATQASLLKKRPSAALQPENAVILTGIQDDGDREHVKHLISRYESEYLDDNKGPDQMVLALKTEADAARVQLGLDGQPLPSGETLRVAYI